MKACPIALLLISGGPITCPAETFAKGKSTKEIILSAGKKRVYYLFVPENSATKKQLPLIVLLHGSGRNGQTLIDLWKEIGTRRV